MRFAVLRHGIIAYRRFWNEARLLPPCGPLVRLQTIPWGGKKPRFKSGAGHPGGGCVILPDQTITITLTPAEVKYIRQFKQQIKSRPLGRKEMEMPSIQIFLKVAEEVK